MSSVSQSLESALKHHQSGELDEAASIYQEIIRLDPLHADALHLLGVTAHQRNDARVAVDYIGRAIAIDGNASLYHSNLGNAYQSLGNTTAAIESFREAIRLEPDFAGAHYNLGMAYEAQGQHDNANAIACYREVIQLDPDFADANNNLGSILLSQGECEEAVVCFRKVVEAYPEIAGAHYNLANALHGYGELEQAVSSFQDALVLNSQVPEIHNNLGVVYKELDRLEEAEDCLREAIKQCPEYAEAHNNLGIVLQRQGQWDSAIASFQHALHELPDNLDVRCSLGIALERTGKLDEAVSLFQSVLDKKPDHVASRTHLGDAYFKQGRRNDARACYLRALELKSNDPYVHHQLGTLYGEEEKFEEAETSYLQAIELNPKYSEAFYHLGNVYKLWEKPSEAMSCFQQAIFLEPEFTAAHHNCGIVQETLGEVRQAIACYDRALEITPDDAGIEINRATANLLLGNFPEGWREYDSRWEFEGHCRNFSQPTWDGSSLAERTILIYAEQGIGDEIMFASCLPDICEQTQHGIIECDPRLVPLFSRSFPSMSVVARPIDKPGDVNTEGLLKSVDVQIAMGSLPGILRPDATSFPDVPGYLQPDAAQIENWRKRLSPLGPGLKIGISWHGGNDAQTQKRRSIDPDQWSAILQTDGVHFINLQYGDTASEIVDIENTTGIRVHDWPDSDALEDLDGFSAQVAALDLVISVDNSTVHLAGALGVPTWVLLPSAANWRWLLNRTDSVWYSSLRLFRQKHLGDWDPVLKDVLRELTHKIDIANANRVSSQQPQIDTAIITAEVQSPEVLETEPAALIAEDAKQINPQVEKERSKYEAIWKFDAYRAYSPGLHDSEKIPLVEQLRSHNVKTILDAGCGSGKLMQKLLTENTDEFRVHGFDISHNCLDPFFDDIKEGVLTVGCLWNADDFTEVYDAIICTDVMEHIPTEHVPQVLKNFQQHTRQVCYLAIALFSDGFGPELIGEPLHLTVKPPNWWFAKLALAGFRVESFAVEKTPTGQNIWLHAICIPPQIGH